MLFKLFNSVVLFLLIMTGTNVAQEAVTFRKTFGDTHHDFGHSVQQTTDGGYVLFGLTTNDSSFNYDLYLIKTDFRGVKQWERKFTDPFFQVAGSVQQTLDGGYILCGAEDGYDNDSLTLIKTDDKGILQWKHNYRMSVSRTVGRFAEQTADEGSTSDMYLVKIDSVGNTSGIIGPPQDVSLTICPNPFFETTYIKLEQPLGVPYTLFLYDAIGKQIREESGEVFDVIEIRRGNLTAGLYFFKLFSGSTVIGKGKLIVL